MSEAQHSDLSRRTFLTASGTVAAAAAAGVSIAAEPGTAPQLGPAVNRQLAASALACVKTGKACLEQCLASLKAGDLALSSCSSRVQEMVLSCGALSRLAVNRSRQAGTMALAVREVASECEEACSEHARHESFRVCADACGAFVRLCRTLA